MPSADATGQRDLRELLDADVGRARGRGAADAMMASDSRPPSGKPRKTLARFVARSFSVQCSSTAPDEKKNTSYGVIAAPNSAMA